MMNEESNMSTTSSRRIGKGLQGNWGRASALICSWAIGAMASVAWAAGPAPAPVARPLPAASAAADKGTPAKTPGSRDLVTVSDGRQLAPEIARIFNRGELIVAMLGVDTPPFFYKNPKGELVGLEVDLAKAIARELKVSVRFDRSAKSFNDVVDVVARQDADLGISKLSRTMARAQKISFTQPYLRLNHAFLINRVKFAEYAKGRSVPSAIRDFKGALGVIANSSFADYAGRYFPLSELRAYPTWDDLLKAVNRGEVIAAYRDEFEVKSVLKIDPTASLTLRTVTFKDLEDTLAIAVSIQDPVLLAFVDQYLSQSAEKLTVDKVLQAVDH
jgi:polar amino acid transport system substrate-binding protein